MDHSKKVTLHLHGYYGAGCANDPAVTCVHGDQIDTCMEQLTSSRLNNWEHFSFAFGETCVNVQQYFDKLHISMPDARKIEKKCTADRPPSNFYELVHCMAPDIVP